MLYRINKAKLKPHIIVKFGSIGSFIDSIGISKMRWSQVTRTNYKSLEAPTIKKIKNIFGLTSDQFLDELDIGE